MACTLKPPSCNERSEERGEERSDERKIVSYGGGRYAAVASLQPSALVQSHLLCSALLLVGSKEVPCVPVKLVPSPRAYGVDVPEERRCGVRRVGEDGRGRSLGEG